MDYEPLGELQRRAIDEVDWNMMNYSRTEYALGIFDPCLDTIEGYIEYYTQETDYDPYMISALAEFSIELDKNKSLD